MKQIDGVRGAVAPSDPLWRRGGTAIVTALSPADPNSSAGRGVLNRIRRAAHQSAAAQVAGTAAGNLDFVTAVYGTFPLMLALIAIVTFVLLRGPSAHCCCR